MPTVLKFPKKRADAKRKPNVERVNVGWFLGPLYVYTAKCKHKVKTHYDFCPKCGLKLFWPEWRYE